MRTFARAAQCNAVQCSMRAYIVPHIYSIHMRAHTYIYIWHTHAHIFPCSAAQCSKRAYMLSIYIQSSSSSLAFFSFSYTPDRV